MRKLHLKINFALAKSKTLFNISSIIHDRYLTLLSGICFFWKPPIQKETTLPNERHQSNETKTFTIYANRAIVDAICSVKLIVFLFTVRPCRIINSYIFASGAINYVQIKQIENVLRTSIKFRCFLFFLSYSKKKHSIFDWHNYGLVKQKRQQNDSCLVLRKNELILWFKVRSFLILNRISINSMQ